MRLEEEAVEGVEGVLDRMNKKSQGLSMQTIVIAVLVLLVIVVVIIVFVGGVEQAKNIILGWGSCEAQGAGAHCIDEDESCPGLKMKFNCPEGQICCISKGEE